MTTAGANSVPDAAALGDERRSASQRNLERPKFTLTEAIRARICRDRAQYDRVGPAFDMTVDQYWGSETPRLEWRPRPIVAAMLAKFFIQDGEDALREGLETEVDPAIDEIAEGNEALKGKLDALEKYPSDVATPEGNKRFGGQAAVKHVKELTAKIEDDRSHGMRHHGRVPLTLRRIATWAPWAEAVGFSFFAAYFLNVPILRPWDDWLGWTFAIVLVVGICLILNWSVHYAAEAHNAFREQMAERQTHEAETSRRNRRFYAAMAAVAAVGITFGMIERGLTALSGAVGVVTVVMVALAAITGLLLPVLVYWAKALDGSRVSRERDAMVDDLDDDLDEYADASAEIEAVFPMSEAVYEMTVTDKLPRIRDQVQTQVNGARDDWVFLLAQLGIDSEDPPLAVTTSEPETQGLIDPISTGIPGAGTVDLQPLVDRLSRLQSLRDEMRLLRDRYKALPPHPWNHSRVD